MDHVEIKTGLKVNGYTVAGSNSAHLNFAFLLSGSQFHRNNNKGENLRYDHLCFKRK